MFILPTGEDLRKLRKKAGLTQIELAEKANLSQSLIARIESASVDPRLSTLRKIFNAIDETMREKKTVEDILAYKKRERHALPQLISVSSNQKVSEAIVLMKKYGVSQLPVIDDGKAVGSIVESVLVEKSIGQTIDFSELPIYEVMGEPFPILNKTSKLEEVNKLFSQDYPAILVINRQGALIGIITKIDLLSYIAL
ncbi:MAG: CBS domain-containing protein [Candidatus Odinarchaeia archaeon]